MPLPVFFNGDGGGLCSNGFRNMEERAKRLFNIYGGDKGTGYAGNVWDQNFISPTVDTCGGETDNRLLWKTNQEKTLKKLKDIASIVAKN